MLVLGAWHGVPSLPEWAVHCGGPEDQALKEVIILAQMRLLFPVICDNFALVMTMLILKPVYLELEVATIA
jgi:hypothetical protein